MTHFPDVLVRQLAQDARDQRTAAVERMLADLKPQAPADYAALIEQVARWSYNAGYIAARG